MSPLQVLTPLDIKPFPVFWHEDNGGQRQLARDRKLVPVARIGPHLGEAAHCLVKSTLIVKSNRSSSWTTEPPPSFKLSSNYSSIRPRPAGLSGYGRGFLEDPNYYYGSRPRAAGHQVMEGDMAMVQNYYGQNNHPQGMLGNPRQPSSNGMQIRNRHRKEYRMR
ncbi:hypothetical protein V6N12_034849 [Hibiscus sabdariffa]|uniref:Uncharacterized protein n=1 Tax=Hibiscus sabdariffa TaxID=183260 RepID=A0ABR2BNL6_9ROSI